MTACMSEFGQMNRKAINSLISIQIASKLDGCVHMQKQTGYDSIAKETIKSWIGHLAKLK